MNIQIKSTHTLTCPQSDLSCSLLQDFLAPLDPDAKVTVRVTPADRPGEITTVSLEAEVDISKGRIY